MGDGRQGGSELQVLPRVEVGAERAGVRADGHEHEARRVAERAEARLLLEVATEALGVRGVAADVVGVEPDEVEGVGERGGMAGGERGAMSAEQREAVHAAGEEERRAGRRAREGGNEAAERLDGHGPVGGFPARCPALELAQHLGQARDEARADGRVDRHARLAVAHGGRGAGEQEGLGRGLEVVGEGGIGLEPEACSGPA